MYKTLYFRLFLLSAVFLFFGGALDASAATLYIQGDNSTVIQTLYSSNQDVNNGAAFQVTSNGTATTLALSASFNEDTTSTVFFAFCNNGTLGIAANLFTGGIGGTEVAEGCLGDSTQNNAVQGVNTPPPINTKQTWYLNFGTPVSLSTGTNYYLQLVNVYRRSGSVDNNLIMTLYGTSGGVPAAAYCTITNCGSDPFIPPASVSLAYPTNGSTTPDFRNWVVNWNGAMYGTMEVDYGQSSSSLIYKDKISFDPFINSNPLPITKSQSLWYPPLSVPATWYAEVINEGATSSLFSSLISFNVSPEAPPPPVSTSTILAGVGSLSGGETSSTLGNPTTNCQNTSSSFIADPLGNIEEGICNSLVFLFIPNTAQQQNLSAGISNLIQSYANKPPFGYFTSIQSDLNGLTVGTTSIVVIPTSSTGTPYEAFAPFQQLDDGLAGMMYLALGFTIFGIARQLDL